MSTPFADHELAKRGERRHRIALVGCGAITESFYLHSLLRCYRNLQRVVCIDTNAEQARQTAERIPGAEWKTDYHLEPGTVEGAIIAVPHHLHYPISRYFLEQGVHVLCEKPIAETGAEVSKLVEIAAASAVTIGVNNTRRMMGSSILVKNILRQNLIGEILDITYIDGNEFDWPTLSGFYFDSKQSRKGILLDMGSHALDLLCWWMGAKPDVISSETDSFGGYEAMAVLKLKYGNCPATVRLSRLSRLSNMYCIRGRTGLIEGGVYDSSKITLKVNGQTREIRSQTGTTSMHDIGPMLVRNFLNVLAGLEDPLVPAAQVIPSIELIDEAYKTAKRISMPWYDWISERTDSFHKTVDA